MLQMLIKFNVMHRRYRYNCPYLCVVSSNYYRGQLTRIRGPASRGLFTVYFGDFLD